MHFLNLMPRVRDKQCQARCLATVGVWPPIQKDVQRQSMPRGLAAVVVWPPIESETIKILGLASNQTLAADLASGVAAVGVWPPMWVELRYGCFQA